MATIKTFDRVSDAVWYKPWTWGKYHEVPINRLSIADWAKPWPPIETLKRSELLKGIKNEQ